MTTTNQPNKNDAKQKKNELKAWRPLKLRILDIGQNTHGGAPNSPTNVEPTGVYRPS